MSHIQVLYSDLNLKVKNGGLFKTDAASLHQLAGQ